MKVIRRSTLWKMGPCADGFEWWCEEYGKQVSVDKFLKDGLDGKKWEYVRWLMVRVLNNKNRVRLAIYSASIVLNIYEDKRPNDNRPRRSIKAANDFLKDNISRKELLKYRIADAAAAYDAADAAYAAAANAADAAAAYDAADAAYAAAAAYDAAAAAYAAAANAADAAYAADAYADANAAAHCITRKLVINKIIKYAIKLNRGEQ